MSDGSVENVLKHDLEHFVRNEAFLWGNSVAKTYFEPAEGSRLCVLCGLRASSSRNS